VRLAATTLGFLLLAAVLAGCADDDSATTDPSALQGVSWVHTSGVEVEGWEAAPPSLTFEEERVAGFSGCNRFGGTFTAGDGTLEIAELSVTQMGCPSPADEVERAFLDAFERVARWRLDGDELVLADGEDEEVLRFAPGTPVGSWAATGFVREGVFQTLLPGAEITLELGEDGDVSGSAGCNTYTATYEVDAASIEISPPGATRRSCAEPAGVMEQERAYLDALTTAKQYRLDGASLQLLDADGSGLVSFTRR
jgi:heat shock protein HslJ